MGNEINWDKWMQEHHVKLRPVEEKEKKETPEQQPRDEHLS